MAEMNVAVFVIYVDDIDGAPVRCLDASRRGGKKKRGGRGGGARDANCSLLKECDLFSFPSGWFGGKRKKKGKGGGVDGVSRCRSYSDFNTLFPQHAMDFGGEDEFWTKWGGEKKEEFQQKCIV